jgi:hypothetical protein
MRSVQACFACSFVALAASASCSSSVISPFSCRMLTISERVGSSAADAGAASPAATDATNAAIRNERRIDLTKGLLGCVGALRGSEVAERYPRSPKVP